MSLNMFYVVQINLKFRFTSLFSPFSNKMNCSNVI